MSRNGNGVYTLPAGNPVVTGTTISSTWANSTLTDIATALTTSIATDGQTLPAANLPMGGFRHTGVSDALANDQYATLGQLVDSANSANTQWNLFKPTATFISATSFSVAGDQTSIFEIGRRIKTTNTGGTVYSTISNSVFGAVTTVTVVNDSGVLDSGLSSVYYSILSVANQSLPSNMILRGDATLPTTPVLNDNDTSVTNTSYVQGVVTPGIRQTVISGPVDANGLAAFGGATGSTTVTTTGILRVTAANGQYNYGASVTNPSWTGLSTNGTMYLYLDITSAGVVTTGSVTLAPVYQWGGTYSIVNNQHTFNIQEMTMKVGNGTVANNVTRVFVGEVGVAGGVVTSITWYALMGRYTSVETSTLPGTSAKVSSSHNIGVVPKRTRFVIKCLTTNAGFSVGDEKDSVMTVENGGPYAFFASPKLTRTSMSVSTGDRIAFALIPDAGGTAIGLTAASWSYRFEADRGW